MTDVTVVPEPEPDAPVQVVEPPPEGPFAVPESGTEHIIVIGEGGTPGPPGTPGAPGPPGPPGPPGVGTGEGQTMVVVDFPTPSDIWAIDVGLSATLEVIDSSGQVVWPGDVVYGPGTKITLHFSAPFSGKVHCYF